MRGFPLVVSAGFLRDTNAERERFHMVPGPWEGPALYVTEQCRGQRRKGRRADVIGSLVEKINLEGF